jgi:RHS repeat-associated protein
MPHLTQIAWDWKDQLETTASQLVKDGNPERTSYRYDVTGRRTVKANFSKANALRSQRIYLGNYEIYREYDSTGKVTLERDCLLVGDGAARICQIETTTLDSNPGAVTPSTAIRYQLGNHLGSAVLELDETAAVITYEEYYPYGATSFQAGRSVAEVSLKRYRYAGKERDAENGFYYHGARYYAPWLGRWTACDPAGLVDGPNLYAALRANPIRLTDPNGTESQVDTAKRALEAARTERDQAEEAAEKLAAEARRLSDRYGQLLKKPPGESSPQSAIRLGRLHQVEQDLIALHPKLTDAYKRSDEAKARFVEATNALTRAQTETGSTPDTNKQTPEDAGKGKDPAKKPTDPEGDPAKKADAASSGGATTEPRTSYGHIDVQALGTYNSSTNKGNAAFGSFDPQIVWIPPGLKDWTPPHLAINLGKDHDLKFIHEPALAVPISIQGKSSGTEVHVQPGAQVDLVDYSFKRLEIKLTTGYQLDLYHLQNVGDNSQWFGQASGAIKLIKEPGDGKNPGVGLDFNVQLQKGIVPYDSTPWAFAGGFTLHTNF